MKKFFLFIICSILMLQNVNAQVGYAPEVGVNFSNMKFEPIYGFTSASTSGLVGPRFGGIVDLDMGPHIYLQPGAFFSSKGATRNFSYSYKDTAQTVNETLRLNYIEVPINVLFKTGLQGDARFFFGLGIDLEYVVGGSDKLHDFGNNGVDSFNLNQTSKVAGQGLVANFDIGLNFTLGYELPSGFYVRGYYTLGVSDISLYSDMGESDKNYAAGASIGYFFGKNRHHKRVVPPVTE